MYSLDVYGLGVYGLGVYGLGVYDLASPFRILGKMTPPGEAGSVGHVAVCPTHTASERGVCSGCVPEHFSCQNATIAAAKARGAYGSLCALMGDIEILSTKNITLAA